MNSKVTSKKEQTHQRIVQAASRAMRRSGFAGVGVAEVMKEAGLTHGGFYAHFPSRDALLAEAMVYASKDSRQLVNAYAEGLVSEGCSRFRAFVEVYLSNQQIAECENGCPVAALCGEMRHQASEVVASSRYAIEKLYQSVSVLLPQGAAPGSAWAIAVALVGAMQLARALGDNPEGQAVLAATKADLIARFDI